MSPIRRRVALMSGATLLAGIALAGVVAPASADPVPIVPPGIYLGGGGWVPPTMGSGPGESSAVTIWVVGDDSCATSPAVTFDPDAAGPSVLLEPWGFGEATVGIAYDRRLPLGLSGMGTLLVSCLAADDSPIEASMRLDITASPASTFHGLGQFTVTRPTATSPVVLDKVGYLPGETVTVTVYDTSQYEQNYDISEAHAITASATADGGGAVHLEFPPPAGWDGNDVAAIVSSATSRLVYDTAWEAGATDDALTFTSTASVPPGGSIAVSGTGYQPGESVLITLHSTATAVTLGTLTADGSGAFSGTVVVPGGTGLGSYRVFAGAKAIGYELRSAALVVEDQIFADVGNLGNPFYTHIQWMSVTGISTGTPQPSGLPLYKPADSVSRQSMAVFLYRLSGESFTPPAEPTFGDVPTNASTYLAVEWMAAGGISVGTAQPSGKPLFKPADPVSRQSMAVFLARFSHVDLSTPPSTQSFSDVPTTASTAAAIDWMKSTGISTGTTQPSGLPLYKPADPVSRQAMAAFLYRMDHL